jgi:hypothetical protein
LDAPEYRLAAAAEAERRRRLADFVDSGGWSSPDEGDGGPR